MPMNTCKILLLSGGADSMLLYQMQRYDYSVFFNYGQNHLYSELDKCEEKVTDIITLNSFKRNGKEVNCRNMTFITTLVSLYGDRPLEIYIGTNSEDVYKDNSREFYDNLQELLSSISFHPIEVKTPLLHMSKKDILKELKLDYYTD